MMTKIMQFPESDDNETNQKLSWSQLSLKGELLKHYAECDEPTHYYQIDGWVCEEGSADMVINPNGERLGMTGGTTSELWSYHDMRLCIGRGVAKEDIVGLLKMALEWVEKDYEHMASQLEDDIRLPTPGHSISNPF